MKRGIAYLLLIAIIFVGCSEKNGGSGRSYSIPAISPASEIVVTSNGKTVETFTFEYDSKGRVTRFVRKDETGGTDLLNLTYGYDDDAAMTISGTMYGKPGNRTITVNHSSSGISYKPDTWNGWTYSTYIGKNGVATGTSSSSEFSSGYYSSNTEYQEICEISGKDISKVTAGTAIKSQAKKAIFGQTGSFKPVSVSTGSSLTTNYVYSEHQDRQNFCALVFACELPVWYAEGLPGCEHLPSDVTMAAGGVTIPQSQHFEYTFLDNGDINTLKRTWISEGNVYLTMNYEFKYKTITE